MTPPAKTRRQWAKEITTAVGDYREAAIEIGRLLVAAKDALPHGDFEKMVKAELPFEPSTARKFMAIAEDPRLADSNRSHVNDLPASYGTLYELTKLDDGTFGDALKAGKISADMTRADVGRIKRAAAQASSVQADAKAETCSVEDLEDLIKAGKKFGCILADPPWKFETRSGKGADRSPDYPTLTIEEICAFPIADLAAKDCALFLWVTVPFINRFSEVLEAWGFKFSTRAFLWAKQNLEGGGLFQGQGFWTRANPEDVMIGIRGSPKCLSAEVDELVVAPIHAEHSRKPAEIHKAIEEFVAGPRIELFGRRPLKGWTVWGDEILKGEMEGGANPSPLKANGEDDG